MNMDPATAAALAGVAGVALTQIGNTIAARVRRAEKADSVLARVLERRDEDCRRLGDMLETARTSEQLARESAATWGAQLQSAMDDIEELKRDGVECRKLRVDYVELDRKFAALEAHLRSRKITPLELTAVPSRPARESDEHRVVLPIMSESVGGYRGK